MNEKTKQMHKHFYRRINHSGREILLLVSYSFKAPLLHVPAALTLKTLNFAHRAQLYFPYNSNDKHSLFPKTTPVFIRKMQCVLY
jgi:hypothetical protein